MGHVGTIDPETAARIATPPAILEAARAIAERLREGAAERDRERIFPHEQLGWIADAGLLPLLVPKEHGGHGGTYMDAVRVVEILSEGDSCVGQIFHVHNTGVELCNQVVPEALKRGWHERTVQEGLRWSNAYSELSGKTIFNWQVRIAPDGDGYRLNGDKFYCTGSLGAGVFYVTAVLEGTDEVKLVFLEPTAEGMEIVDDWDGMGQRCTGSGTIRFRDARVSAEQVCSLGDTTPPESLFGPLGQLSFSAIHLGIVRAAARDAQEYVSTRARAWVHSGVEKAVDDPLVAMRFGELRVLVSACEALQERAIDLMGWSWLNPSAESRAIASVATSEAKAFTTEAGLKVCELLYQLSGSSATLAKYGYDRHWRNLRTMSLHDPADYKYKMVGDYYLTGNLPPVTAYT